MSKPKYPSYWIPGNCKTCNKHVGRLIQWIADQKVYVVRMVQTTCKCEDRGNQRIVTMDDMTEYCKRCGLGEPGQ